MKNHKLLSIVLSFIAVLILTLCSENPNNPPDQKSNDITNPPGGQIIELATNSKGDFFAATATELFCSTNKGGKWDTLNIVSGITDLLVTTSDVLFISYFHFDSSTLLRSFDNGDSWTSLPSPHLNYSLCENSKDGNIFSYGQDGLYKSSDMGETWDKLYQGLVYSVCTPNDSVIIIAIPGIFSGQIFYSSDNGNNWSNTGNKADVSFFNQKVEIIYAGTKWNDEGMCGLIKSADPGLSWVSVGLEQVSLTTMIFNGIDQIIAATTDGVYLHITSQNQWQKVMADSIITTFIFIIDKNKFLYAGSNKGSFL